MVLLNMRATFTFSGPGLFFFTLLSYAVAMDDPNNFNISVVIIVHVGSLGIPKVEAGQESLCCEAERPLTPDLTVLLQQLQLSP